MRGSIVPLTKVGLRPVAGCFILLCALAFPAPADETQSGLPSETASAVIGQPDFAHPFANRTDARGMITPAAVAVDTSVTPYRLYVADVGNHHVLGYRMPMAATRPAPADLVIGQPDMLGAFFDEQRASRERLLTPAGLAVDREGNLYVCDRNYNRVVEFDRPFETDTRADRVIGQGESFETIEPNHGGLSAASLNQPCGIAIDSDTGTLWIADTGNNRVLGFRKKTGDRRQETEAGRPGTDVQGDVVLGQPDFKSNTITRAVKAAQLFR